MLQFVAASSLRLADQSTQPCKRLRVDENYRAFLIQAVMRKKKRFSREGQLQRR